MRLAKNLTVREMEILRLICAGYNRNAIATKLKISARTVDTHRHNIYCKTNTNGVAGLMKYALVMGYVQL